MKITEILLEPDKIYVNEEFKIKFRANWTWQDLKNGFTYENLKVKSYKEFGGNLNGKN